MSNNWIKCSERLPPINVQIIAYKPGIGQLAGGADICIRTESGEWFDEGGTEIALAPYTHWQPLPEPPTDDKR